MALAHFMMLNNELLNKYIDVVPEKSPLNILDRKKGKDTKHTRHISRRNHLVINGGDWILHKTVWCEGGLPLAEIGTKNVREDELNHRLGYTMVRLDNWQNTYKRWVKKHIRVWITICFKWLKD